MDSSVTGPPMLTAAAHEGRGTCGRVNRTWPGTPRCPKRISIDDPDDDHEQTEAQKEGDGARPGRTAPTGGHDDAGHRSDQRQEERVVRPHGGDGKAGRPQPPRHRVQGAAPGDGGPRHSSAGLRRQRTSAKAPSAMTTTAIRTTGSRLLDEPAAGAPVRCRAAAMRCASDDPWVRATGCRARPAGGQRRRRCA